MFNKLLAVMFVVFLTVTAEEQQTKPLNVDSILSQINNDTEIFPDFNTILNRNNHELTTIYVPTETKNEKLMRERSNDITPIQRLFMQNDFRSTITYQLRQMPTP